MSHHLQEVIKPRSITAHKGDYGRILVVGGSPLYVGAPAFVAMAAYAAGADIVKIIAPEKVAWTINTYSPHLITLKLPGQFFGAEHIDAVLAEAAKADVVVVGSGLSDRKETLAAVLILLQKLEKMKARILIDADAFKAKYVPKHSVITPHEREFLTVFDKIPPVKEMEKRREAVRKAAEKSKCVILLKGGVDIITDGKRLEENMVHNPEMTVGGTGDTLAGILATFWAQSDKPFESAGAAAWVNGLAGDLCLKKRRRVLPHWLIENIPEAMSHSL
jgi:hydroxyethylthiazole kinase-like uncharacterized protein yjeF